MTREELAAMQTTFGEFKGMLALFDTEVKGARSSVDGVKSELAERMDKFSAKFDLLEGQINTRMNQIDALAAFKSDVETRIGQLESDLTRKGSFGPGAVDEAAKAAITAKRFAFEKVLRKGVTPQALNYTTDLTPEERKSLTVANNPAAGYLAPKEYVMEILSDVTEWSPLRQYVRIRTTGRQAIEIPRRTQATAASWVTEIGTRSETQNPAFTMETIPTHELYAMVQVSQQELEDSLFDLQQFLREEFAEQFGVTEGAALAVGSGVGKPEGLMTAAGVGGVNSGHATEVTADGLLDLYFELKEAYLLNATWAMNRSTLRDVRKLKDANGNYLWAPGIKTEARPAQLLDRPYVTCPDFASIGAGTTPIMFGDLRRAYILLDRIEMSMLVDPLTSKRTGLVEISARKRVGGQVVLTDCIKKLTIGV